MDTQDRPFFIGWAALPRPLRDLMLGIALGLVVLFGLLGLVVAATQDDPGAGGFAGRAEAVGVLTVDPYPIVHVESSEVFPEGSALLLSGFGKRGVQERAAPLDGQRVQVQGLRLERGTLLGMQLAGGERGLAPAETDAAAVLPATEDLGRWRLTGEICDGKCLNGAMRPGTGLAHKACANLCLIGGVPPVFVATDRVDGAEFFLIGGPDGGPVTDALLDHTARLVEVEGRIERRGELHVFLIEPATMRFR